MEKSALILGGAGFIGRGIAQYLAEHRDYRLTIADLPGPDMEEETVPELVRRRGVEVIEGDFTDPAMFSRLKTRYDYVYMLASLVGVNKVLEHPDEVIRANTALIWNTLEWLRAGRAERVLFASSSECYSGTTDAFGYVVPTSEDVPLCVQDIRHPRFTYAVTKMLGESGFFAYAGKHGFLCTVVRYQNIYGPRMGFKHAIPHLVERFWRREDPFKVYGSDQTRAFCYLTDAAEGTVLAMERGNPGPEVYHIGSMDEITIDKLTRSIGTMMGYVGVYEDAPTYPGSVSRRCPDIRKATRDLCYTPKVTLRDGLERTIAWYLDFFRSGKPIHDGGFKAPGDLRN